LIDWASTSESKAFTDKDHRDPARVHHTIDDQQVVYTAGHPISATRSIAFEWKAVFVDMPKALFVSATIFCDPITRTTCLAPETTGPS